MAGVPLDDFRDVSGWSAVASGQAVLALAQDAGPRGKALRLDFDFKGGGGFVVARKSFSRRMPEVWALEVAVRGAAPANKLEIKLADPSNKNVWWWHRDAFEFPADWQPLRIRSSEVALRVGPGGRRPAARARCARARDRGGSGRRGVGLGRGPALRGPLAHGTAARARIERGVRCRAGARARRIRRDELAESAGGGRGVARARLRPRARVRRAGDRLGRGRRSARLRRGGVRRRRDVDRALVRAPGGGTAQLRLPAGGRALAAPAAAPARAGRRPHGIRGPASRRAPVRLLAHARRLLPRRRRGERRGLHPRWLYREQSYWTPVGVEGGTTAALLNEEGLVEPDRGSFSLEPFWFADDELVTWADVELEHLARAGRAADSVGDLAARRPHAHDDGVRGDGTRAAGRARGVPRRERRCGADGRAPVRGRCARSRASTVQVLMHWRHCTWSAAWRDGSR